MSISSETARFGRFLGIGGDDFLTRLKDRESDAVTLVIREYSPILYRMARGARLAEDHADEVVQGAWEVFFSSLPSFEARSQIKTYLVGILLNKIREHRRARARTEETDEIERVAEQQFDADGYWIRPPIAPDRFLEAAQNHGLLLECLEELPETHRTVILLREWEGFDSKEICNSLSISVTNLGVMVHRAKDKLRRCLEKKASDF